jgi:hypothetical protein
MAKGKELRFAWSIPTPARSKSRADKGEVQIGQDLGAEQSETESA